MIPFAIVFFVLLGIALIIGRREMAQFQANVMGGRMLPGCVVAQGVGLFILALVFYLARDLLR